jgi:ankyrin repeat protein
VFVQYTLPKDDLYAVVRASKTTEDLVLLRRLLLISRSNAKWKPFGENLLLDAATDGNQPLLVMLLDVEVDVNAMASSTRSSYSIALRRPFNALQTAVHGGYENLIDILTRRGAQIFIGDRQVDYSFLCDAIYSDNLDFAKPLLAKAATSDIETTRNGVAVLVLAMQQLYGRIVNVLLEAGFSPYWKVRKSPFSDRNSDPDSAFAAALSTGRTEYLKIFLRLSSQGLDEEQCRERLQQLTAGYAFACSTGDIELRNAISDTEWDLDEIDHIMGYDYVQQCLYDALEVAAECGDCDKVGRLIQIGTRPDYRRREGDIPLMTPLGWAVLKRNVAMVRQLIAGGADVSLSMSGTQDTPLHLAVIMTPNVEIVHLLVEAGANINAPTNSQGRTAIELAAQRGSLETVTYLLEAGADIRGQHNRSYRRAVYRAQNLGCNSIIGLLQDWKRLKYGEQDCDSVANIMSSMTLEEFGLP